MATKTIAWNSGTGNITVTYTGSGDGTAVITSSDNNLYEARSQQITFQTTAGSPQRTVTVTVAQAAKQRIDLSTAVVTAANQTYSGSALTPTPTVTLNGDTVPSTGYDVAYSNNTNAGTATITITGKGDYTGTATGTFTIAKANPTYIAPTAQSLTYNRSSQYLTTTGSTSDGTIQYSSDGSTWGTTRKTSTNAGSYTTYWRLVSDSNHNDVASTSISVTISKATPVVNVAPSKASSLTYTGSAQNLLTGGSMKHSSTDSTAVAGTFTYAQGTNAGTYNSLTWSFAPTDTTNYNNASGSVSGSVSIAKANPTYTAPTANNRTYNTSSAALLNAGSSTTAGTFTYCATQSGTYSTTIPSQTNAGTYTTYWKFTPTDTTNYNSIGATSVSTTISPKTVSSPTITLSQSTYTYNGSAKTPTPTVKDGSTTISSSEYTVSYSNNTNAGTATCTITDKSGGNYTVSGSKNFTINKASRTLSFTDSIVVLPPSSNVTKTATPSAGSGDGAITYSIASTTYATINSSTGKVTSKTSEGKTTVTATIAEGTNYLSASASYTLYVFATTHNYSTASSYSSLTLPVGSYKLQCWGAQGGSNAANSTYGITSQTGGKGGYSEGQLTISSETTVRVYVGGQGSSSAGGYNGGGGTSGSSTYNSGGILGVTTMGGGGGSSDIRLSSGSLYSRMIVAGGGSGAVSVYKKEGSETVYGTGSWGSDHYYPVGTTWRSMTNWQYWGINVHDYQGKKARFTVITMPQTYNGVGTVKFWDSYGPAYGTCNQIGSSTTFSSTGVIEVDIPASAEYMCVTAISTDNPSTYYLGEYSDVTFFTSTETESREQRNGFAGGGTNGDAYYTGYAGEQGAAGTGGSFGQGANQSVTNYRFCSAAGGGGWYGGGGGQKSNSDMAYCRRSGGGSGFVNTSASSSYRPSGYTGLQLDSGTTYAGTQTFLSPSGTNETGHAGNGYVRITRL